MKQLAALGAVIFILFIFFSGIYIGKKGTAPEQSSDTVATETTSTEEGALPAERHPESYVVSGEYSYSDMSGFTRFSTNKGPLGTPAIIVDRKSIGEQGVPDGTMIGFPLHNDTVGSLSPFGDSCTLVIEATYEIHNIDPVLKKDPTGADVLVADFKRLIQKGNVYDSCWSESGTPTRTLRQPVGDAQASSVKSVTKSSDNTSVTVQMRDGKKYVITLADIKPHDMGMMPTGSQGEMLPTTCAPQGIYKATTSESFKGKVLLSVSSGMCAYHSDFSDTIIIDPVTKSQYALTGNLIAISQDGTCSLQEVGDGDRGASPHYAIVNPYSGAVSGTFDTFFQNSPLQQSFTTLSSLMPSEDDVQWFTVKGFEAGSCRVVFSTRDPKRYGGVWTFSVNVWGKNPKLISKPN